MSKYSSDSNSRDRTRSYNRYYNQRHRSSSSSSTDNTRHSRKHRSSKSGSRHHKKSKRKHRSNSSSDYSSSRHKHSSRSSYRKEESRSKKKHRRSSSSSSESSVSNYSYKDSHTKSSKSSNDHEKNKSIQPVRVSPFQVDNPDAKSENDKSKTQDANWLQQNVYDVMKRQNSIEQIKQEGFVFKVFKPSSEQKKEETNDIANFDVPKLNEDIINSLSVEESTFLISNRERLLNARYKLLTKKERCNNWAKHLFASYKESLTVDN